MAPPIEKKSKETEDLKKRIKKTHDKEEQEAKHDLMTALRVAMRKMLREANRLST